jgi:hypothetical protein
MFNSFGSSPRILRLFCRGEVAERGSKKYNELTSLFKDNSQETGEEIEKSEDAKGDWQRDALLSGSRAIILLHIFKVQTSCGYGVPRMDKGPSKEPADDEIIASLPWTDRTTLPNWVGGKTPDYISGYRVKHNTRSLDGLPGLGAARRDNREWIGVAEVGAWTRRVFWAQLESLLMGILLTLVILGAVRSIGEHGG